MYGVCVVCGACMQVCGWVYESVRRCARVCGGGPGYV